MELFCAKILNHLRNEERWAIGCKIAKSDSLSIVINAGFVVCQDPSRISRKPAVALTNKLNQCETTYYSLRYKKKGHREDTS